MTDRILWNLQPKHTGDAGDIDEIVIHHPEAVHIEQMDDRGWWIAIYLDGDRYWMGNFTCDSRGRMSFSQQENYGLEWDDEDTHERNLHD